MKTYFYAGYDKKSTSRKMPSTYYEIKYKYKYLIELSGLYYLRYNERCVKIRLGDHVGSYNDALDSDYDAVYSFTGTDPKSDRNKTIINGKHYKPYPETTEMWVYDKNDLEFSSKLEEDGVKIWEFVSFAPDPLVIKSWPTRAEVHREKVSRNYFMFDDFIEFIFRKSPYYLIK
jgi:hypothetical protein